MSSHFQETVSLFGRLLQLFNELYIIVASAVPLGDKIWIEYKICCQEEKIRWRISSRAGKEERWLKFMKHKVEHLPFFFLLLILWICQLLPVCFMFPLWYMFSSRLLTLLLSYRSEPLCSKPLSVQSLVSSYSFNFLKYIYVISHKGISLHF